MRRVLKSGLIGLLVAVTAGAAPGGRAKAQKGGAPALNFELPPVPLPFSARSYVVLLVEPRRPMSFGGMCGGARVSPGIELCGGWAVLELPARKSKLPDPGTALGAAYRKCRAIRTMVLEPRVPVPRYPEGYFGEWIHEGVLVTDRSELTGEDQIGRVFTLLMEAVGHAEDLDECWIEDSGPETSASEYRRETGFMPDLIFEFVGEVPLRVELSLGQRRVLVQAGDKWDCYTLDRWSAVAFGELVAKNSNAAGR